MYEKIKKWYAQGLWTEKMVKQAVEKAIVTPSQGQAILEREEGITDDENRMS